MHYLQATSNSYHICVEMYAINPLFLRPYRGAICF